MNEGSSSTTSELEADNFINRVNEFIEIHWQNKFDRIYQHIANYYGNQYVPVKLRYLRESKEKQDNTDTATEETM